MRDNNQDLTLARNYIQKYRFLVKEYELELITNLLKALRNYI